MARLRYCALEVLRRGLYLRSSGLAGRANTVGFGGVLVKLGRWPNVYLCLKSFGVVRLLADALVSLPRQGLFLAGKLSCERYKRREDGIWASDAGGWLCWRD